MGKIGVVVCGNSGIDYIDHPYEIPVLRSILLFDGKEYTDFVDIKAEDFYKKLLDNPNLTPSTAQTATGVILETYEKMRDEGFTELLVITLSSKLSGTHDGAVMASNMVEGIKVTVYDSLSIAYPEAKMALTAAQLVSEGKSVPEIIKVLDGIRQKRGLLVSVDTLKYLVKGGRLSGASGFVGSLLKVKPMLELTADGRLEAAEKIRTRSKAIDRMIERFTEENKEKDLAEVFVIHANAPEEVKDIRQRLQEKLPSFKEIKDYPLTPVVGAHAGPGALAIGWLKK
jgi:DegV family protein with EDD domain